MTNDGTRSTSATKRTNKAKTQQSIAALCQKYSMPATRQLINRIMDTDPQTRMKDSDLIKAVETINSRAFGKPMAQVEMKHEHTHTVQHQHLVALKDAAAARMRLVGEGKADKEKFAADRAEVKEIGMRKALP